MEVKIGLRELKKALWNTSLAEILEAAQETCEYCHPLTPLTCTKKCNIWRLKKDLRELRERTKDPNFSIHLLNTLKNKRRSQILQILSNRQHSTASLQRELKKSGYYHSQQTITEEYVDPLINVGVIDEEPGRYRATLFGYKLNELIADSSDIEVLPPHSECYEEKTIEALHESPKNYEELRSLISTGSLSRILKRLEEANLITRGNKVNYVFYFKTRRNPRKEKLSPTERRVHKNIPEEEGIAAQRLAARTNISLRRTYKYLRKLRGKKLAFKRKSPKTYALTEEGRQIAKLLEKIHVLITELIGASVKFSARSYEEIQKIPALDIPQERKERPQQILVRT